MQIGILSLQHILGVVVIVTQDAARGAKEQSAGLPVGMGSPMIHA